MKIPDVKVPDVQCPTCGNISLVVAMGCGRLRRSADGTEMIASFSTAVMCTTCDVPVSA